MLKKFLLTILIFLLSGGLLFFCLTELDPLGEQANISLIVFYLSLFLGIGSFFTLLFFFLNEIFAKENLGDKHFFIATRRGFLVSLSATLLIFLQMLRFLGIIEALLIIAFFILLELIFASIN